MDLGGREREREEEEWQAREDCGDLCVCGGAQRARERADYISFNSFRPPQPVRPSIRGPSPPP